MLKKTNKPWYKSMTIKGALATGLAIVTHPAVFALLPAKWSNVLTVIGGVVTTIGMRRAIPETETH